MNTKIFMHRFSIAGALKPKDHCCYDVCGAVIHIETKPGLYGYGNTLDVLHDSVRKYLPLQDEKVRDSNKETYSRVI